LPTRSNTVPDRGLQYRSTFVGLAPSPKISRSGRRKTNSGQNAHLVPKAWIKSALEATAPEEAGEAKDDDPNVEAIAKKTLN
jgi:hypothetical protein